MENNKCEKDILHIVSEEKAKNYRWEQDSEKLNPNVGIVSLDKVKSMEADNIRFKSSTSLCEGMVFAKHPYIANCYVDIKVAEDELFKDKLNTLSEVAHFLGVKEFIATAKYIEENKRELTANGSINYKVVDVNASYKSSQEDKYAKCYHSEERFDGAFTPQDYQKAKELIKGKQLEGNDEIRHLLELRNPEHNNLIKERTVKVELTRELNNLTEIAFGLNILKGVFKLDANVQKVVSTKKKVILETKLVF